jgi:MFS family permease
MTDIEAIPHNAPLYRGSRSTSTDTTLNQSHASEKSSSTRPEREVDDDDDEVKDRGLRIHDVEEQPERKKIFRQPTTDLRLAQTKSEAGPIYIEFGPDDPDDPFNWPAGRKAVIAGCAFLFSASTAITGTGWTALQEGVMADLGCSQTIFLFGNTLYLSVGIAFTPLILAPFSEMFGRQPIFLTSSLFFALVYLPEIFTRHTSGLLIGRLLQGCCGSVGNSLVGGTVSDLYAPKNRGFAMSLFAVAIYGGQAIGPFAVSYTVFNPSLGWRWAFGWQAILGAGVFLLLLIFLRETRGTVILSRRARKMTEDDANGQVYKCSADDDKVDFITAVKVSLSRPAWWLISEPIVTFFSLWIGFLWGTIFLLLESVPIVFDVYGWTESQKSLVLLNLGVGALIGWAFNFHQEKLYARAAAKAAPNKPPPEARLYWACVGGILTPIGMFIFAWTGRAGITPVAPIIGLVVFSTGTFWIYLAVFTYIAECYEIYASSGLAAQSWLRNVLAGVFPLFAPAMYHNLEPAIASTILAVIALVLGICPFVLFFYGGKIRSKSKVAKALAEQEQASLDRMIHEREKNEKRKVRKDKKDQQEKETAAIQA